MEQVQFAGSEGATLLSVGASIAGDLASVALGTLAAAIDEASRERTFGGRGVAVFNYFDRSSDSTVPNFPGLLPGGACLNLVVPVTTTAGQTTRTETGLAARFMMQAYGEGFALIPLEVRYVAPLGGLRSRDRLPVEFTAKFSVPGENDGGQSIFGVAQISLPSLRPGESLGREALQGFSSSLMRHRPLVAPQPTADGVHGAVSVEAQIFVRRAANNFGVAIATALRGRQSAASEAVSGAVARRLQDETWAGTDSAYFNALIEAREALASYAAAVLEGDATKIGPARIKVVSERGEANVAAASAGRPAPFPDPLIGL